MTDFLLNGRNTEQEENEAHLKHVIELLCVAFEIDDLAINALKFFLIILPTSWIAKCPKLPNSERISLHSSPWHFSCMNSTGDVGYIFILFPFESNYWIIIGK